MDKKSKQSWHNSIKTKLMVMAISFSIIPLLFLGVYGIKLISVEIENSIHKEHVTAATRISQGVMELVNILDTSLETIGLTNSEIYNYKDEKNAEDIIYRILRSFPQLEEVSIIKSDGNEVLKASKRQAISSKDVYSTLDKKIISNLKAGKINIGRPTIDEDNQIVFDLIAPTVIGSNEFLGAIKTKVNLRHVMEEITGMDILKGSYIMLIDEEGSLIGHSDYSQVLRKQNVKNSKGVETLIGEKNNKNRNYGPMNFNVEPYTSYTGEEVLGVYGKIPIVGWGVVVEQPIVDAYSDVRNMIYKLSSTLIIILIIISFIVRSLILKFIEPVEELGKGVDSVKKGNFDYKIPKQGTDEIGLVVDAFNDMTSEIKKKRKNESLTMLAEKRAAIGTLAAGVAHEINNPMNNLGFYAIDLIDRIEEEDVNQLYEDGVLKEYLEIIKEQIKRASDITQNLLRFSRESEIDIRSIDICKISLDVLKLMEHRLRLQNVFVETDFQDSEIFVLADESQMQQVLLNIITNAVDEMPKEGKLKIKIKEEENLVVIRVIDNGKGIKDEDIGRIFDPFFTTKPVGEGTGLGLAISQSIVERMRGSIDIVSEYNKGTEIIINLPMKKELV